MLRAVTHKTDAWQIIKGFARAQNGRQAYLSLMSHFKGRGHVSRIKTDARNVLVRIFWEVLRLVLLFRDCKVPITT